MPVSRISGITTSFPREKKYFRYIYFRTTKNLCYIILFSDDEYFLRKYIKKKTPLIETMLTTSNKTVFNLFTVWKDKDLVIR